MARTLSLARPLGPTRIDAGRLNPADSAGRASEMGRHLLWLIPLRAAVLILALNLAEPLAIFPERLAALPFVPFFNILSVTLTLAYLGLWWNGRHLPAQLMAQVGVDLALASVLVASTGGLESPFVSFYLLIIIYCSLTLGRRGAVISAALSIVLYSAIVGTDHTHILRRSENPMGLNALAFRLSSIALGFVAVAFLGTYLSQRLRHVQAELKEKIDSLQQLRRLNEHIVSSIRSGLITTDLEGRITLFNKAAEELTGRKKYEAVDQPIRSVFGDDFHRRMLSADLLKNARPLRHESWIASAPENRRFLGYSVSPLLDHENRLIGYTISFQDLTEIRQLEEAVRLKDRLATIGRMAAGIAHEIRNPLTSVRGSVEILRSHASLPASDARLLDIMLRESDRLNEFVEDLLYFARPGRYRRQPTDLAVLLRDSVTLLGNNPDVCGKYQIRLHLEKEPIAVLGNSDKLKQVFWNLTQNALRAMPDGGTLTISANYTSDGVCHVLFEDTGVGFSQEEKENLFQPFQSGFARGTGLGLSIVFQILEDHGGKIQFDSEKSKGTRVTLTFPSISSDHSAARRAHL